MNAPSNQSAPDPAQLRQQHQPGQLRHEPAQGTHYQTKDRDSKQHTQDGCNVPKQRDCVGHSLTGQRRERVQKSHVKHPPSPDQPPNDINDGSQDRNTDHDSKNRQQITNQLSRMDERSINRVL